MTLVIVVITVSTAVVALVRWISHKRRLKDEQKGLNTLSRELQEELAETILTNRIIRWELVLIIRENSPLILCRDSEVGWSIAPEHKTSLKKWAKKKARTQGGRRIR
jgi:hypothetical protein